MYEKMKNGKEGFGRLSSAEQNVDDGDVDS
jgi:hypothetical protein